MNQDIKRTELSDEELKAVTGGATLLSSAAVCASLKSESDCKKLSTCKWTGSACEANGQMSATTENFDRLNDKPW